ncbi:hypothetical protein [Winogradskyella poriferorum]|uniref:hypothetical protein n=1 Tax=Winogradskyella poriferorum TaxID=307627 RepID=UPI003D65639B
MMNKGVFIMIVLIFNCLFLSLKAQESKWIKYLNYEPFYFAEDEANEEYEIIPRTAKDYGLKGNVLAVENEFKAGYQTKGEENKYKFAKAVSFFENGFISSKYLKRQKLNYASEVVEKTEYVYGNEAIVNGKILSINKKVKEKTSTRLKQEGPKIEFEYRYTNEDGKTSYTNGDLLELMIYVGENLKIQRVFTKEGKLFRERRYHKITTKLVNGYQVPVKDGEFYLSTITSYSYDDQMRITRKSTTKKRPNGEANGYSTTKYTYEKVGNDLQVKITIDNHYADKTDKIITYNSAGHPTSVKYMYYPDKKSNRVNTDIYKYEYEYDSKGNWIKRKEFFLDSNKNYKLSHTRSRKIFYHD